MIGMRKYWKVSRRAIESSWAVPRIGSRIASKMKGLREKA